MIFPYGPAIAPWTTLKTLTSTIRNRERYREDIRNIVITNVLNNLSVDVVVRNINVGVQICAAVEAINTDLLGIDTLTCEIQQRN